MTQDHNYPITAPATLISMTTRLARKVWVEWAVPWRSDENQQGVKERTKALYGENLRQIVSQKRQISLSCLTYHLLGGD